jgi:methyl-accepting chemotaxis protein
MSFHNMSFARKLILFSAVVSLIFMTSVAWSIYQSHQSLYDAKRRELVDVVEVAESIVGSFAARAAKGELSEAGARADALTALRALRYQDDGYVWINDLDHVVVMHPIKPELDGKDVSGVKDPDGTFLFREFVVVAKTSGRGFVDYLWPKPGSPQPVSKVSYVSLFKPWGWVIGSGLYTDDVEDEFAGVLLRSAAVLLLLVATMAGLAWVFVRSVAQPLAEAVSSINRLADGDLDVQAVGIGRGDEIGALASAINAFKTSLRERQAMAERERSERAAKERRQHAMDQLVQDLSTSVAGVLGRLTDASGDMLASAETVSRTSATTMQQSVRVGGAASEANENVRMVAAAAQQLAASISEVTRQVGQAHEVTSEAQSQAEATSSTVVRLEQATDRISEVLNLISSIAGQTNLLALNATIEAARAGEAGKGLAVVASEVKSLAAQTARATDDIAQQIAAMQQATKDTTAAIAGIADVIDGIGSISSSVEAAMREQNLATQEIVRSVDVVAGSAQLVSSSIDEVRTAAGESGAASEAVTLTSRALTEQTQHLRKEVTTFLDEIRSAGERRNYERHDCRLEAEIECRGRLVRGTVLNVGIGGALFDGTVEARAGDVMKLRIDGTELVGAIVEAGQRTRVRFSLDAAAVALAHGVVARIAPALPKAA